MWQIIWAKARKVNQRVNWEGMIVRFTKIFKSILKKVLKNNEISMYTQVQQQYFDNFLDI